MRPFNRSLHPDDYVMLRAYDDRLHAHLDNMIARGVPHREWHPHRFWEYASVLQQLDLLCVPRDAEMIDLGSGASFFDPMLAQQHPRLVCTDNMQYGDVEPMVAAQRAAYGVMLHCWPLDMQDMSAGATPGWGDATDKFDVTLCISSVEHVADHDKAFAEMVRITKPGGYVMITSDYFRDLEHFEQSVSRHLQVTPYRPDYVAALPERFGLEFVGDTDFEYRGDFVHNYSFVNLCMRKRAASTPAPAGDNGKAQ